MYNLHGDDKMKYAKGFIICESISIFLLLLLPFLIVILNLGTGAWLYIFTVLLCFVLTAVFGVKSIIKSRQLSEKNDIGNLRKMWLSVKLINIPAFILNFIVCAVICLTGFIFFPLNLIVTVVNSVYVFMCVVLSGVVGIIAVKAIKKEGGKIHSVFIGLQFIPFWDVIGTLITVYTSRS